MAACLNLRRARESRAQGISERQQVDGGRNIFTLFNKNIFFYVLPSGLIERNQKLENHNIMLCNPDVENIYFHSLQGSFEFS